MTKKGKVIQISERLIAPQYILREADLREMIKDGSIKSQHFLVQILADGLDKAHDAVLQQPEEEN